MEPVWQRILKNPPTSTHCISTQLDIARKSLQKILKQDLKLFLCKIQMLQALPIQDTQQQLQYTIQFQHLATDNNVGNNLIISDEAHFQFNGYIKKQNCIFWGTKNPRELHRHQLHPQRCTVRCGVIVERVISTYFFENEEIQPERINRALQRLEYFLCAAVKGNQEVWLQQDGATADIAKVIIDLLQEVFGEGIISKNSEFVWLSHSLDLTALDFCLCIYLKEWVYVNKS